MVSDTNASGQWVRLEAARPSGSGFRLWLLCTAPLGPSLLQSPDGVLRYVLQEGDRPSVEYRDRSTGGPLLPSAGANAFLVPRPAGGTAWSHGIAAASVDWLGLAWHRVSEESGVPFMPPQPVVTLEFRTDTLIGIPGTTRTRDDVRRFDGSEYPMVKMTQDDYRALIQAGMNHLHVEPDQASWVRHEPVFYWGPGAVEEGWPECLFRPNYIGPAAFFDEPAVGTRDADLRPKLSSDPSFRRALTPQVALEAFEAHFHHAAWEGAPAGLMRSIRAHPEVDVGSMNLVQPSLYTWETMIASGAWQLTREGDHSPAAIVFEPPGRIGSRRTLPEWNMVYGCQIPIGSPANFYDVLIGFLRGAARVSGKRWGVSIYGGLDQADAPWFLTHAHDLGATHFFFWDNYQLACVPFGECLALARHLRAHADSHPNRDLDRLRRSANTAILIPPGYDLGHVYTGRGVLWGLPELNLERKNQHGVTYRAVMSRCFAEIADCLRSSIAFDVMWDLPTLDLSGYATTLHIGADGRVRRQGTAHPSPAPLPGLPPELEVAPVQVTGTGPWTLTLKARVAERTSPVYYTPGPDPRGVFKNVRVLWELFGPGDEDYRATPAPSTRVDVTSEGESADVAASLQVNAPGSYRLRAATVDVAGRSTVQWRRVTVPP
jgi:hypothetical protein